MAGKRNLVIAVGLLLVPIAGALAGALLPGALATSGPPAQPSVDALLELAGAAAQAPEGVRGAPLGAAPAAPQAPPAGAPGMPSPDNPNMIPQASWDLLKQVEQAPASGGDLYKFDRTPDGQFLKVTFAALGAYKYELPDPEVVRNQPDPKKPPVQQIPDPLMKLGGEKAVVVGFMVPFDIDRKGNVKSFALTQNQMFCCFGIPPGMNEMVMVTMEEGKSAQFMNNIPIAVYGKLEVGEEIDDGYVLSLYRMTASEAIDVKELLRRANAAAP